MKYISFLLLTTVLVATTAQAETIDASTGSATISAAHIDTQTPVCSRSSFILRNSGTLVTGLKSANIQLYSGQERVIDINAGGSVMNPIKLTHTLTATVLPGVYTPCFKPSVSLWKKGVYSIEGLVRGTTAADNGHFTIVITSF